MSGHLLRCDSLDMGYSVKDFALGCCPFANFFTGFLIRNRCDIVAPWLGWVNCKQCPPITLIGVLNGASGKPGLRLPSGAFDFSFFKDLLSPYVCVIATTRNGKLLKRELG